MALKPGDVPYREYLCGRCRETFRVSRCSECGAPTAKVIRNRGVEVVASAELVVSGINVRTTQKAKDGTVITAEKLKDCHVVLYGLPDGSVPGLQEHIQAAVDAWTKERRESPGAQPAVAVEGA